MGDLAAATLYGRLLRLKPALGWALRALWNSTRLVVADDHGCRAAMVMHRAVAHLHLSVPWAQSGADDAEAAAPTRANRELGQRLRQMAKLALPAP